MDLAAASAAGLSAQTAGLLTVALITISAWERIDDWLAPKGYVRLVIPGKQGSSDDSEITYYYLRVDPKEPAPEGQHKTAPNAHLTAPWPMGLGWGVSGDNLCATFMPRLCVPWYMAV